MYKHCYNSLYLCLCCEFNWKSIYKVLQVLLQLLYGNSVFTVYDNHSMRLLTNTCINTFISEFKSF